MSQISIDSDDTETNNPVCAYCGQAITSPAPRMVDQEDVYCSFRCEVRALWQGMGWGIRWFGSALMWGLVLFAFIMMLLQIVTGYQPQNPPAFYSLIFILGLLAALLTIIFRRM